MFKISRFTSYVLGFDLLSIQRISGAGTKQLTFHCFLRAGTMGVKSENFL